ncbi:uncharacterized protein RHIMIDRAFT_248639 [Rhizopus microsporus ATCC 52813]|uniref:ATPase dynein-related AAA domain-containing protein n=1 Tax=Rhizopus microsporus ATCC 52813 TaxID=1340429 RepID=A0A2G4T467_RHIZD|nr:uncharacterized protein RHIMIDRAFT_248639 [Rhizopus microsporus ATCC 52813]PHZ15476.1 hypothetical protein RHIMIDRAFT_248639 [Rhizopus microsporus ATCC 52813]
MSQDSKEWIKSRMNTLKKQAGFAFNEDVFISVLLCLVSGRDKHLILTAPPGRLKEVTQLASQICRCLFGLTTAQLQCHEAQTQNELVDILFSSKDENNDSFYKPSSFQKASRTFHTTDFNSSRNTTPKLEDELFHTTPISPVDFTLKRTKQSLYTSLKTGRRQENEEKRPAATKIVQALLVEDLDKADESIQAVLLELMINKELRLSNIRYNVPKPFFLIIAVLPHDFNRRSISAQLIDRFFISYQFEEEMFQTLSLSRPFTRRQALMRQDEIKVLSDKAKKVHVHIDISRYVRDIVVGIRTHPRVKGGITARSSQDLVTVIK